MKGNLTALLAIPLFFLLLSCSTTPATESRNGESPGDVAASGVEVPQSESETAAEADARGAPAAAADAGIDAEDGPDAGEHPEQAAGGGESTGDGAVADESVTIAATSAEEPGESEPADSGPLPPPLPVVSPAAPQVGEEISIETDRTLYETVTFDFGGGAAEEATHTYSTFGVKSVIVTATAGDRTASAELSFPVTGTATLHLETDTVEHDAAWQPLIEARLEPNGDFDTVVVYENQIEVLKIPRPDEYKIPAPFAGQRTFTAALFQGDQKVADVGAVTIIGLNSPPGKPVYEGQEFISGREGEEISFTVTSDDPNNDLLLYKVKFAPEDAQFDELNGIFTWTPTGSQRGVYLLHFTAYDQPYGLASQFTQRGIMVQ